MTTPNEPAVHRARANVFQHEATWRLAADALEREGGEPAAAPFWAHLARFVVRIIVPWALDPIERGGLARFPYAQVRDVRLSFDPTRFDTARHRCDLRLADGRKVTLFSTHYAGVGNFEDRGASFAPLVRGLVARVAAANPACRFHAGKGRVAYWAQHVFLFAAFGALVFVLFAFGGAGVSELVWLKLAIVASFIPVLLSYSRKNWPRAFSADAIPKDVLPDMAGRIAGTTGNASRTGAGKP